jgi:hypothetical protein
MNLYQFTLPVYTNNRDSYEKAHAFFQEYVLKTVGGYTDHGQVDGYWKNAEGREFRDRNRIYTVATTPAIQDNLIAKAFDLFPDQEAIYSAQIGEATITMRQTKAI